MRGKFILQKKRKFLCVLLVFDVTQAQTCVRCVIVYIKMHEMRTGMSTNERGAVCYTTSLGVCYWDFPHIPTFFLFSTQEVYVEKSTYKEGFSAFLWKFGKSMHTYMAFVK